MQEFELENIWQNAHSDANDWYQQRRTQLLARAAQRSQGVLHQLQRQFVREMILSLSVGGIFVGLLFSPNQWSFWAVVVFWLGSSLLFARIYYRFQREAQSVPLLDVKTSTAKYLHILRKHALHLQRLYRLLSPLGLIAGYFIGFSQGNADTFSALKDWSFWAISLPVLALTAYLGTYYARWRYQRAIGRREEELEDILRSLDT